MSGKQRPSVQTAVVWETLTGALERLSADLGKPELEIVDVGGGVGGFAVPVARLGHRVAVIDPSPDTLATLGRRAAEEGVGDRVVAEQGDTAALVDLLTPESSDVVLCHGVLETVEEPLAAISAVRAVLRRTGIASVLVGQRYAAVLSRALTGQVAAALEVLTGSEGNWVAGDPLLRRFDESSLGDLLAEAGLRIHDVHGVRVFADLVPGSVADDPPAVESLYQLEAAASVDPALRAIAGQLHVLAVPA